MSLLALQRDFEGWLTREPAALPASFDETHRAGLAVYLNNYRSQLMACLAASYPVVRAVMGDAAFDAAAAAHIEASPPESWTLDAYAEGFPARLTTLFAAEPTLGEVAMLELALSVAFVGEDCVALDPSTLAQVDWEAAVLEVAPTLVLLPVTTNAGDIWTAVNAGLVAPSPAALAEKTCLVVWRTGFVSKFRAVSLVESEMLARMREGSSFGEVCAEVVGKLGEEAGTAVAGAALGQWLADGIIVGVSDSRSSD